METPTVLGVSVPKAKVMQVCVFCIGSSLWNKGILCQKKPVSLAAALVMCLQAQAEGWERLLVPSTRHEALMLAPKPIHGMPEKVPHCICQTLSNVHELVAVAI